MLVQPSDTSVRLTPRHALSKARNNSSTRNMSNAQQSSLTGNREPTDTLTRRHSFTFAKGSSGGSISGKLSGHRSNIQRQSLKQLMGTAGTGNGGGGGTYFSSGVI